MQGAVEARGTYTELRKSGVDFAKKLAVGSEDHEEEEMPIANSAQSPVHRNVRHTSESSTVVSRSCHGCHALLDYVMNFKLLMSGNEAWKYVYSYSNIIFISLC
jgi:hypothetical protein